MNHRAIKATVSVLSFVGGLACLGTLAHYAGAKSVHADSVEPAPIMMPEVTITGELSPASIIQLPEQFISAKPSPRKVHGKATSGRIVRTHELAQGGSPDAPSVVYWDSNR